MNKWNIRSLMVRWCLGGSCVMVTGMLAHAAGVGACCIGGFNPNNPSCEILTAKECQQVEAGRYLGDGTTCMPFPCDTRLGVGACCIGGFNPMNPSCEIMTRQECGWMEAGRYLGNGTTCDPFPCFGRKLAVDSSGALAELFTLVNAYFDSPALTADGLAAQLATIMP